MCRCLTCALGGDAGGGRLPQGQGQQGGDVAAEERRGARCCAGGAVDATRVVHHLERADGSQGVGRWTRMEAGRLKTKQGEKVKNPTGGVLRTPHSFAHLLLLYKV